MASSRVMEVFAKTAPAPEAPDESELLTRARGGDPQAMESLLRHYQGPLFRYSMRMCGGNAEDARDVLQESLLSAARHLDGFRGDSKLSTWLFTIARRLCGKHRRRSKFAPAELTPLGAEPPVPHPGPWPEDQLASRELMVSLERALGTLEPANREIVVLRDVEGLTAREVAQVVGMTEPQVKSRLHRARVAIRQAMAAAIAGGVPSAQPSGVGGGCPDIARAFSRFLEDDIDAGMCDQLQRHVDTCSRCRGACHGIKRTLAVCRAVPEPTIPEDLQVAIREAIRAAFVT